MAADVYTEIAPESDEVETPHVTISIVSHGHGALVEKLLEDIARFRDISFDVILTLNIQEEINVSQEQLRFPFSLIQNATPAGFGSNHNAAAKIARGELFCVLNPDVRFTTNPFPTLVRHLTNDSGVIAPVVVSPNGTVEDNARPMPTPYSVMMKAIGARRYANMPVPSVDWVAGMFMLFRRSIFLDVGGFDERYFLYYEDVDICCRLWLKGYRVRHCTAVSIVHDARRSSHRSFWYFTRHLMSMIKFFTSASFVKRLTQKYVNKR